MKIESIRNQIFKETLQLQDKKFRDKNNLFIVEGKKQVKEISKYWHIKQIFISEKHKNTIKIKNFTNVIVLSENLFNKLVSTQSPQGIMAVVKKKQYNVKKIVKTRGLFIILENIQDPGNLGTIIRSANSFAAKAVFVSKGSADIYSEKTLRATMGSIFHLPVINDINIEDTLNIMKKEKITIFAASIKGEKYLNDIKFPSKKAFIIGNEANGLKSETEDLADELVKIYMPGRSESLNVAIAASIIMYEATKR
ncbi:MAG: RNA methyltransferase [Endomicrobium sp.]|jgi:TrmH family RNA methyltransferase|nr:RNA methyltransferase [Endomicrobium sp.]